MFRDIPRFEQLKEGFQVPSRASPSVVDVASLPSRRNIAAPEADVRCREVRPKTPTMKTCARVAIFIGRNLPFLRFVLMHVSCARFRNDYDSILSDTRCNQSNLQRSRGATGSGGICSRGTTGWRPTATCGSASTPLCAPKNPTNLHTHLWVFALSFGQPCLRPTNASLDCNAVPRNRSSKTLFAFNAPSTNESLTQHPFLTCRIGPSRPLLVDVDGHRRPLRQPNNRGCFESKVTFKHDKHCMSQ